MGEPNYLGGRRCKKCRGPMKPSKAFAQTLTSDEGSTTLTAGGVGRMVECLKCTDCGWSITMSDDPHDGDAEWGDVGKLEASHEKQPPRPDTYIDWPDDNHGSNLPRGWWLMISLVAGVLMWIGILTTIWYLIA